MEYVRLVFFIIIKLTRGREREGKKKEKKKKKKRERLFSLFLGFPSFFFRDELQGKIKWQIGLWKKKKHLGNLHK